jgi:hypothetical protein
MRGGFGIDAAYPVPEGGSVVVARVCENYTSTMKPEYIYERRQAAYRMEAVMLVASVVGMVAAVVAFFNYGWLPGFAFLLLGIIAYALSRVFDLLADLLATSGREEQRPEQSQGVKDKKDV